MKEMVGGCCVCSDERGWTENPLVYCDGQGCTVAVHQACYGIVTVPTGPWFCRKCESQERAARVRCELCPSREGALKRTDNNGWAHVICALYIPEVRFGNVSTMEPIVLLHIPAERYSKTCYICEDQSKGSRAAIGACMQCNKAGCKQQFHVTCAQAMGLLCEEAGNYMDNVKYCGYCEHHYSKLKKGGNVKTIPAYRPVLVESSGASDAASEKDSPPKGHPALPKKKGGKATPKSEGDKTPSQSPTSAPSTSPAASSAATPNSGAKFTASNFVEVTPTPAPIAGGKKRKSNARNSPPPQVLPPKEEPAPVVEVKVEVSAPPPPPPPPPVEVAPPPAKSPKVTSVVVAPPPPQETPPPATMSSPEAGGSGLVFSTTTSHVVEQKESVVNAAAAKMFGGLLAEVATPVTRPRGRSQSTEKSEKGAKKPRKKSPVAPLRRGRAAQLTSPPLEVPSTSNTAPMNSLLQFSNIVASAAPVAVPSPRPVSDIYPVPDTSRKHMLPKAGGSGSNSAPKSARKDDNKEYKPFQNGVGSAPHMLGNILNPNSSMAQKMADTLNAELEAHSVFSSLHSPQSNLTGPPLPSKMVASARTSINNMLGLGSPNSMTTNSFTAALTGGVGGAMPQSLDQLLERQWEQGSQFLMEQAQHFDIASLLTCLHQLRAENVRLEEHVMSLQQRRDHLLAVNARLAIPLPPTQPVTAAMRSTPPQQRSSLPPQMNNFPMENGMPSEASIMASFQNRSPVASSSERNFSSQPAPPPPAQMSSRSSYYERQSPAGQNLPPSGHPQSQAPQQHQQTSPHSNNMGTLRMNPHSMPEQYRREEPRSGRGGPPGMPQMQMYSNYQAVSPPVPQSSSHQSSSHVTVPTSHQQMVIRREGMGMEHSNLMLHMHHHQKQS